MVSTKYDRSLLAHFVPYYISIGIDPRNMYLVLHSGDGVQKDIDEALHIIRDYPVNYRVFKHVFYGAILFQVLVRRHNFH